MEYGKPPKENSAPYTHEVVAALLAGLPECQTILDIPSGEGALARRLTGRGLKIHAADCQEPIERHGAVFRRADMNAPLPYGDNSFDAVVSIDGIEHIERPFDFIRECARVVRHRGWLILSTPNISALRSRWRWFLTGFHNKCKSPLDETRPAPLHHVGMLSFPESRYLLHANGFRITAIRTNRIKGISWCLAPVAPLAYLATRWVFAREETDPSQRRRNREILGQMFSLPVLFGETMILLAQCEKVES